MTILSVRQLIQQAKTRRMDNEDVETAESSSFRSPLLGCQLVRRGILHEEDTLERFRVKDAPSKVYVIVTDDRHVVLFGGIVAKLH
ncbi:hypothetical protein Pmar_PMAR013626 [Perkinsus marinus ATCC 50983]|uniref:Uncharacterized protein n=1 Tax=Perkinsus marinus (strain ATCC 50983 / TXsc) TaxID=423536 RepID=C5KP59_PERM5|nr:hypothetical protein Pmar_PMAR013626 [Perkinsus marinus ATCC 50983]EER13734.1 hypothetical protein Pmar_PMAR013626 [Perkinsus marinus ATCC 50983]|eukprot:XP_002781939.1 hypothetical protein Pmar_PMAR013626 [Perkinsus marinus ATCC 50983]